MKHKDQLSLGGFLIGVGVGAGLGLLFAPSSGAELRDNISEKAKDLSDNAKDRIRTLQSKLKEAGSESFTGTE